VGQTDQSPFVTANGTRVRDGIVAANFLKFQTRIRLPELYGDKIFVVTDRMHERYTNRVDIWMEKKSEALRFGVKRRVKIEIL
jgi:3D (Asp-Asp-Asp) domain-containing protein